MKGERLKRQFLNSLRWPIYVINSVDNTNYPVEHETVLYECIEFFLFFFGFHRHTDYSMSDPISIVSLLCEAMAEQGKDVKAQVNHRDKFGQTPLHRAALRGATICALNLLQVKHPLEICKHYNQAFPKKKLCWGGGIWREEGRFLGGLHIVNL